MKQVLISIITLLVLSNHIISAQYLTVTAAGSSARPNEIYYCKNTTTANLEASVSIAQANLYQIQWEDKATNQVLAIGKTYSFTLSIPRLELNVLLKNIQTGVIVETQSVGINIIELQPTIVQASMECGGKGTFVASSPLNPYLPHAIGVFFEFPQLSIIPITRTKTSLTFSADILNLNYEVKVNHGGALTNSIVGDFGVTGSNLVQNCAAISVPFQPKGGFCLSSQTYQNVDSSIPTQNIIPDATSVKEWIYVGVDIKGSGFVQGKVVINAGENKVFRAGQGIKIGAAIYPNLTDPVFHVKAGATFRASIEPCTTVEYTAVDKNYSNQNGNNYDDMVGCDRWIYLNENSCNGGYKPLVSDRKKVKWYSAADDNRPLNDVNSSDVLSRNRLTIPPHVSGTFFFRLYDEAPNTFMLWDKITLDPLPIELQLSESTITSCSTSVLSAVTSCQDLLNFYWYQGSKLIGQGANVTISPNTSTSYTCYCEYKALPNTSKVSSTIIAQRNIIIPPPSVITYFGDTPNTPYTPTFFTKNTANGGLKLTESSIKSYGSEISSLNFKWYFENLPIPSKQGIGLTVYPINLNCPSPYVSGCTGNSHTLMGGYVKVERLGCVSSSNLILAQINNGCVNCTNARQSFDEDTINTENLHQKVSLGIGTYGLFPNPSNGKFIFYKEEVASVELIIYNTLGQEVWRQNNVEDSETEINLSGKSLGIYQLKINNIGKKPVFLKIVLY